MESKQESGWEQYNNVVTHCAKTIQEDKIVNLLDGLSQPDSLVPLNNFHKVLHHETSPQP